MRWNRQKLNLHEDLYLNSVLNKISRITDISIETLKSQGKQSTDIVVARQLYFYIAKMQQPFKISYAKIGFIVGKRDHSTVLYGIKSIERDIDVGYRATLDLLEKFGIPSKKSISYELIWKNFRLVDIIKAGKKLNPEVVFEKFTRIVV